MVSISTVEWTDSTDENGILKYEYQIHYPLVGGGYGDWKTFPASSQYSGSLNGGIHTIKVRAINNAGNVSEWSNECTIIADWTVPDMTIDNPAVSLLMN